MKNKLIIAAATLTGAFLIACLMKKREAIELIDEVVPAKKSHHLTNVFANAKSQLAWYWQYFWALLSGRCIKYSAHFLKQYVVLKQNIATSKLAPCVSYPIGIIIPSGYIKLK